MKYVYTMYAIKSIPNPYDQLVINLTNNVHMGILVFNDIGATILEEESWRKNKEDRLASP